VEPRPTNAKLVLHVFPTFAVGGAQVRFAALANHFGAEFRHIVVALDGDLSCAVRLDPRLDVVFPRIEAPKNAMLRNILRFRALLREWRPDVMVTCNWGAIEFALANARTLTRHIHVVDGFGPEERNTQIARRILIRRMALANGTVVLPSHNLMRIATQIWKLRPRTCRYVPNGIDLGRFSQAVGSSAEPMIGTVAILRPEKNLGRLIRAFAAAYANIACRLMIVGDGTERGALEALAASLNVTDRVTFTGHRDDIPALYAGFDVFALTSDTEQMPLSVMEAMASGLPVVATDVGDIRGMIAAENVPFLATLDDEAVSGALAGLLRDRDLRRRIGAANLATARQDFDQASMFAAWRDLWLNAGA
jgi:glycosyltransferase involved in cell wall biosynthesis